MRLKEPLNEYQSSLQRLLLVSPLCYVMWWHWLYYISLLFLQGLLSTTRLNYVTLFT